MNLTDEEIHLLQHVDRVGCITDEVRERLPGVHFCPDWDGLPVFNKCPEMSGCTCDLEEPL